LTMAELGTTMRSGGERVGVQMREPSSVPLTCEKLSSDPSELGHGLRAEASTQPDAACSDRMRSRRLADGFLSIRSAGVQRT
jgi:hypothetical protein